MIGNQQPAYASSSSAPVTAFRLLARVELSKNMALASVSFFPVWAEPMYRIVEGLDVY